MNMKEYQLLSMRTLNLTLGTDEQLCNYAMGLMGEAGETGDYLKKCVFHGHDLDRSNMVKELGDVLFYVAALATTLDLDLGRIAEANVEKLRKRYPDGFSVEDSKRRADVFE